MAQQQPYPSFLIQTILSVPESHRIMHHTALAALCLRTIPPVGNVPFSIFYAKTTSPCPKDDLLYLVYFKAFFLSIKKSYSSQKVIPLA